MRIPGLTLLLAASLFAAPAALAQDLAGGRAEARQGSTIRVDLAGGGASQALTLPRGKSAIIELPVDARDVLVTNPEVADAVLRTPRRIYVLGVAAGQTDAVFFDGAGRRILSLDIRVDQDTGPDHQSPAARGPGARRRHEQQPDPVGRGDEPVGR